MLHQRIDRLRIDRQSKLTTGSRIRITALMRAEYANDMLEAGQGVDVRVKAASVVLGAEHRSRSRTTSNRSARAIVLAEQQVLVR